MASVASLLKSATQVVQVAATLMHQDDEGVDAAFTELLEAVSLICGMPVKPLAPQVAAQPVSKKEKRDFSKLSAALPFGVPLSITSGGDKWITEYTSEGFKMGDRLFKSPMAFGRAHADRITDAHPKATKPGNGWMWITAEEGEHKGKTIARIYDEYYGTH